LGDGMPMGCRQLRRRCLAVGPDTVLHGALVEALRLFGGLGDTVFLCILRGTVFVAKGFERKRAVNDGELSLTVLHLQKEVASPCTGNMEGLVAVLVGALHTSPHALVADVAEQLPPRLGNLFNVHDRLHKCRISESDLWNPHGTEEMSPFGRRGLFERAIRVGTKDACLRQLLAPANERVADEGAKLTGTPRPISWHFRQSHWPSGMKGTP